MSGLPGITVVLFNLPLLLGDMLADALSERAAVRVVRSAADEAGPAAVARRHGASFIIVEGSDPGNIAAIDPPLAETAAISLLALADGGAHACLHTVQTNVAPLEDISIDRLVTLVTSAADRNSH